MANVTRQGPSGGSGGTSWDDASIPAGVDFSNLGYQLKLIRIRSGGRIDQIQAVYSTPLGDIVEGDPHGGNGGFPHDFSLPKGSSLTQVDGTLSDGNTVASLQFTASNGSQSELWGTVNTGPGRAFSFKAPPGFEIIGFFGNAGSELDALGAYIRKLT